MRRSLSVVILIMTFVIGAIGSAGAVSSYVSSFTSTYPGSGTASFSCSICHTAVPSRNAYGTAYANAGHNFQAIESQDSDGDGSTNIAEINAGTNPGDPTSKPAPAPVACTGYNYSAWSTCGTNGQQTRTVLNNTPSGCTGTPSAQPVLTQACTPPTPTPTACTGYNYSAWSACGTNGQQSRTVLNNTPSGCTGTPSTQPVLAQTCTPLNPAPEPTPSIMPVPSVEQVFTYEGAALPVVSADPAQAKPVGFGPAADGGEWLDVKVNIGPFDGPVDASLVVFAPSLYSDDIYFMSDRGELDILSEQVNEEIESDEIEGARFAKGDDDEDHGKVKFSNLMLWKHHVTELNENVYSGPVSDLKPGLYVLVLDIKAPGHEDGFYRWTSYITIP